MARCTALLQHGFHHYIPYLGTECSKRGKRCVCRSALAKVPLCKREIIVVMDSLLQFIRLSSHNCTRREAIKAMVYRTAKTSARVLPASHDHIVVEP